MKPETWCKWLGHVWSPYALSKNSERTVSTNRCKRCGLREKRTEYSDVLKKDKVEFYK